jgi:energy-coupling factor transporter transmembrane protein EcfT
MKPTLPDHVNDHPSYQRHRNQVWTQILLPILFAVLVFVVVIIFTYIASFRNNGDVGRWAAISTIWLILPVMIAGFILLILLSALIYLMVRVLNMIPPYSFQVQRFVYRIESGVKHFAELFRKPMLALQELARFASAYIEKLRKANTG